MRWTAAWLLALAVHVASVGLVWLCLRTTTPDLRSSAADAVELVEVAIEAPPPPDAPAVHVAAGARAPEPDREFAHPLERPSVQERAERARRRALDRQRASVGEPARPGVVLAPAPPSAPSAPGPSPVVPSMLDLRPRGAPAAPAPATSAAAAPVAAGVDLNLRRDPIAEPPAPSAPVAAGGHIETPTLRGEIARDGALRIRNKGPVSLGSDLLAPKAVIDDWLKDPKQHAAAQDGTIGIVRGKFDVTDSIMRAIGQDPYRAQRMKMLDDTREQRLTLAAQDRTARQGDALATLPATLRNIWNDGTRSVQERRRVIFQLWDECQEPAEGEGESAAAGARARAVIVLFIRSQVGPRSGHAYPKEELAALNLTRQSRQPFDPYGRSPL